MRERRGRGSGRERAGGLVVVALVVVLALLFGGGYAAAYYYADDKLPSGTTVGGVDVGGLGTPDAARRVRDELGHTLRRTIPVLVDGTPERVDPVTAGLRVDYAASVEQGARGHDWSPSSLWQHYTGGEDLDPVLAVDTQALDAELDRLQDVAGREPQDGEIDFARGRLDVTDARPGVELGRRGARTALERALLARVGRSAGLLGPDPAAGSSGSGTNPDGLQSGPVTLPVHEDRPDIDARDVQRALSTFANRAISASVSLEFGATPVRLQPAQFSAVLSMRAAEGKLVPKVDDAALADLIGRAPGTDLSPKDASVRLVHGRPRVVPAELGVRYQRRDLGAALLEALGRQGRQRTAVVRAHPVRPDVGTREARSWRIREVSATATTGVRRSQRAAVRRAAASVSGTLLRPKQERQVGGAVPGPLARALERASRRAGLDATASGGGVRVLNDRKVGALLQAEVRVPRHGRPRVTVRVWSDGR